MSLSSKYFRKLRRNLLNTLYSYEISKVKPSRSEMLSQVMNDLKPSSKLKRHAKRVISAVIDKRDFLDEILRKHIRSTLFDSMGELEKTILRIGAAEVIFYRHLVPVAVAVSEAVNLAKLYVDKNFASLVNATLKDIVEQTLGKDEGKKKDNR